MGEEVCKFLLVIQRNLSHNTFFFFINSNVVYTEGGIKLFYEIKITLKITLFNNYRPSSNSIATKIPQKLNQRTTI